MAAEQQQILFMNIHHYKFKQAVTGYGKADKESGHL